MDIDSVCLSHRHDFGLLPEMDKQRIRAVAESWLHAFEKHGFGYLGDAEAKQPAQPDELTREGLSVVWEDQRLKTVDQTLDAIFSRILQDRAATEARMRAEPLSIHHPTFMEIADLRATIADLEKRLENAVEIDWSKYAPAVLTLVAYCPETNTLEGTIATRPTPAKLTPEQMAEAWVQWRMKNYTIPGGESGELREGAYVALTEFLMAGKSIETLYAEIKGGG